MKVLVQFKTLALVGIFVLLGLVACQAPQAAAPDYSNRDKAIELFVNAWNDKDASNLAEFLTENFERWENGKKTVGNIAEMKALMEANYAMSTDAVVTIEDYYHSGDKGFVKWTYAGTNDGPLGEDMPATGTAFTNDGISMHTYTANGKISKEEIFMDTWNMNAQLGFTMVPPVMEGSGEE